jgi:hypothetical protein
MWMQKSMEGTSINSHTNFSNRQGGNFSQSSYGGGSSNSGNSGDWKSKILESGQWIGGKVIEYGGKLARGNSHDAIPDSYSHQPRNDGRANWMADIRNSSSSFQGGYNRTPSNTYQNDFATERPPAYSDYSNKPASSYGMCIYIIYSFFLSCEFFITQYHLLVNPDHTLTTVAIRIETQKKKFSQK